MKPDLKTILKNALPYGLILGVIQIILSLLTYIMDINMFSIWFSILNFLILVLTIPAIFGVIGTNKLRLKFADEKKISYLQAALSCFAILLISYILSNIYAYIFYHVIDPEFIRHSIDKFTDMMHSYNVPDDVIEKQVAKIEKNMSLGNQLMFSGIIVIVYSLILALFIRKKEKLADKMV